MCSLFGIIDNKNRLSGKNLRNILKVLAEECEVRGTDATGIAYNCLNWIHIYKKPVRGSLFRYYLPDTVHIVTGHTRMTTKGCEKNNVNNHPFYGKAGKTRFALAHNGVLYNDEELRKAEKLPDTPIETDSFVAVQLLEKSGEISFEAIRSMAERLNGTFCFSILTDNNEVYLVKGNNPLHIYDCGGFYVYASTKDILDRTLKRCRIANAVSVKIAEGDILKFSADGTIQKSSFVMQDNYYGLTGWAKGYCADFYGETDIYDERLDEIIEFCSYFGVNEEDIILLVEYGYSYDEIEELLYFPDELKNAADDLRETILCDQEGFE